MPKGVGYAKKGMGGGKKVSVMGSKKRRDKVSGSKSGGSGMAAKYVQKTKPLGGKKGYRNK